MNSIGHTALPQEPLVMRAYVEITPESEVEIYLAASGTYRILVDGKVHPCLVGMTKDEAQAMVDDFHALQAYVAKG